MTGDTCHVSRVTCHVSHVTCHVSHFFYFYFYLFFLPSPPQKNIGPMIRIGREIQCLPYAGFFTVKHYQKPLRQRYLIGKKSSSVVVPPPYAVTSRAVAARCRSLASLSLYHLTQYPVHPKARMMMTKIAPPAVEVPWRLIMENDVLLSSSVSFL